MRICIAPANHAKERTEEIIEIEPEASMVTGLELKMAAPSRDQIHERRRRDFAHLRSAHLTERQSVG